MASSSSRRQVTITLGRSGQVVKRRAIADTGSDDEVPFSGKKRPMRERLGNNAVDSDFTESQQRNKRRQLESNDSHGADDHQIGKDDLRLKLMRKGLLQRKNGGDLREKLSRNRKNLSGYDPRGHVPESKARYDMRDKVLEPMPRYSLRESISVSRPSAVGASRVPSARSVDDLRQLDTSRNPYSWVSDGPRHRSPEMPTRARGGTSPPRAYEQVLSMPSHRSVGSSWVSDGPRHMSPEMPTRARGGTYPPRAYEQVLSMPSHRSVGSSRAPNHTTRDAPDTLRAQLYMGKSTISADTAQRANGITPSSPARPTAPAMAEAFQTVPELLNSLGLERYCVLFQAEEVDMAALRQMAESDLKDMGVPMGPRKKILLALGPTSKPRQR